MKKKAMLWEREDDGRARCELCCHGCVISEGKFGFCGVRECRDGELLTRVYGRVISGSLDPVEKKPLYHFTPGARTYSVAAIGCNFTCGFCQNWRISDSSFPAVDVTGREVAPSEIVKEAIAAEAGSISYTYTEPTVFFEYAYDTSVEAAKRGLRNIFVTNGYMTPRAAEKISPFLDAANVDLKFFRDASYRKVCGASLKPVLETIVKLWSLGTWIEVTTLVIPGLNDSREELEEIADFLVDVDPGIPWHVSRFHPDHKFTDIPSTPYEKITEAVNIGKEAGLRYVYPGNIPGLADTLCPDCGKVLVERRGYTARIDDRDFNDGKCGCCGRAIEGVWR